MSKIQFHFKPQVIESIRASNPDFSAEFTGPIFENAALDAFNGFFLVTTADGHSYLYNPADVYRIKVTRE